MNILIYAALTGVFIGSLGTVLVLAICAASKRGDEMMSGKE